jgi:hypothetical protein
LGHCQHGKDMTGHRSGGDQKARHVYSPNR